MSEKSRLATLLFSMFLGGFGAHRFYVGKTGSAVAQLILTISFVGSIISGPWVLIDFIRVVAGEFKDQKGLKIIKW